MELQRTNDTIACLPQLLTESFRTGLHLDSKQFRRWCIILRITEFSDFVHRPNFYLPFYSTSTNVLVLSQFLLHIFC
jgi:hypothetical protein